MAYARRDIRGGAVQTTITGAISDSAVSCSITTTTGWPDGSVGGFYVVIDPGTASEEKVLCSTRSASTVNFTTRGTDGSTAYAHASGAVIYPIFTAVDADEANYAVSKTVGLIAASGDLLVGSGANVLAKLAKGSNSTVLNTSSGGTVGWTTIAAAMIADSAVTNAKLAGMTRGTVKVGNSSAAASDLAIGSSGKFLKSDGTDVTWQTGGGDQWTTLRKAADESVTSSTTLQNDDDLFFTAANGTAYYIEMVLIYASPAGGGTPDLKISLGESGTTAGVVIVNWLSASDTASGQGILTNLDAGGAWVAGTGTTKRMTEVWGTHVGAGGTFRLQWAQANSNVNAVTVYTGSYLRYRTVS